MIVFVTGTFRDEFEPQDQKAERDGYTAPAGVIRNARMAKNSIWSMEKGSPLRGFGLPVGYFPDR